MLEYRGSHVKVLFEHIRLKIEMILSYFNNRLTLY